MGTTAYRIKDWDRHFETAESRKRKGPLTWVADPTKHDGRTFGRLSVREDKVDVFCAWELIKQVAAKMPTRGTLIDGDGHALTADDLAHKTRFPARIFEKAFEVLVRPEIGWLEAIESAGICRSLPESAGVPAGSSPTLHNSTGQDSTEQNSTSEADRGRAKVLWSDSTGWQHISDAHTARWQKAYPACDIESNLSRMDAWLRANPKQRKDNYERFIVNWLSKQQQQGGDRRGAGHPAHQRGPAEAAQTRRAETHRREFEQATPNVPDL